MRRLERGSCWALCSLALGLGACSGDLIQAKSPASKKARAAHDSGPDIFGNAPDTGASARDASLDASASAELLIEPQNPTLTVTNGQAQMLEFKARLGASQPAVLWSISRAEIGAIDAHSGQFSTGSVGGQATITASAGTRTAWTFVNVVLMDDQNGTNGSSTCAAGGCGGVGGEGEGPAVSAADRKTLDATPADPQTAKLSWLYPYDGTVWPLGLLAPLLQWSFDPSKSADAIKLELDGNAYHYVGYFGRPAQLAAGVAFVRHPIPQDVWDAATRSSRGGALTVKLTALANGSAYGPITETWPIAAGTLKGTVYYQSYGTKLAHNYEGAQGGDGHFGGATLAIQGGSTEPALVAGSDGDHSHCRVCHTVSADGSRMIVQHGDDYQKSSSYALNSSGYPETAYMPRGVMGWAGLYPDGSVALGNTAPLEGNANSGSTALLDANSGMPIKSQGLTDFVTHAGMPMFSPDGTEVAFVFHDGPGNADTGSGDESKLVVMSFDHMTSAFSQARLIFQGKGGNRPGWPAFMPTGDQLVFQIDLPSGTNRGQYFATRYGARGELWWVDLKTGAAHPLDRANGKMQGSAYLPTGPDNHDKDAELNYEPTVNPIASGGYAWVVFTSRRLYGNVATIDPFFSDPREHDLTATPTPKKLWVAAIDLPKPAGEVKATVSASDDPSHPAFYLPAQELLAGNSRGFWVPEPCRKDGADCDSGDQCCGGFCTADAKLMKNVCGGTPPSCAQEYDRCTTTADCCTDKTHALVCINNRCALPVPS